MMMTAASPVGHPFASTGAASSWGAPTLPKWRACFIASAKSCVGAPQDEAAPVDANGWPTGDAAVIIIEGNPGTWAAGTYALSFTGSATVTSSNARATGVSISNVVYSG